MGVTMAVDADSREGEPAMETNLIEKGSSAASPGAALGPSAGGDGWVVISCICARDLPPRKSNRRAETELNSR